MHFMPEDEGYVEKLWPEGYKEVIRNEFKAAVNAELNAGQTLQNIYQKQYTEKFPDFDQFAGRIADMVVIGAENGSDEAFDDIVNAFLYEYPLPGERAYASYVLPQTSLGPVREKLSQVIVDEYRQDEVYTHAFRVGYYKRYPDLDDFLYQVATIVARGVSNGADDMLTTIYRSFLTNSPLPPARRNPRRVKNWIAPAGSLKREVPV